MYLLDTCVIAELRTGKAEPSPTVVQWAWARPADTMYLSVITIMELEASVMQIELENETEGRAMRAWLERVEYEFEGRVLTFTDLTAMFGATLQTLPQHATPHAFKRPSLRDSIIAASAIEHGMTLATCSIGEFKNIPNLQLVDLNT